MSPGPMKRINIIKFEPGHLPLIDMREADKADMHRPPGLFNKVMAHHKAGDAIHTGLGNDGNIMFIYGIRANDDHCAEIWFIMSKHIERYPKLFCRTMKHQAEGGNLLWPRLQCLVKSDSITDKRFIELMGFEYEGTLRRLNNHNENFDLYARLK